MAGSRPKTFLSGAQLTWKWQRLVWWVFAVCFILALVSTRGSLERLGDGINHSAAAQRLVNGFDISAIAELTSVPDAPLQTSNSGGLVAAFVFTIFMLFVTGGIIATFVRDEKPEASSFFEACGYHFWRFFRLMIYFVLALIPVVLVAALVGAMYGSLDEKQISPMPAVHVFEAGSLVVLFLLMVARLWFDMAQVVAVFEDEKRMHKALRIAFMLVVRNFFSLFWLYFRISVIGWVVFVGGIWLWMTKLAPASTMAAFFVSQLIVLLWIGTRMWQRASEAQWYKEWREGQEVVQPVMAYTPVPAEPVAPVIVVPEPIVPPAEPA
jgi:hypothetical protein